MTAIPTCEWRYDPASSRPLWLLAHGFCAALGAPLLLAGSLLVLTLPDLLFTLKLGPLLLIGLFVLVGGPMSLLYLWPMLTDPRQRLSRNAFIAKGGTSPWTVRSAVVAAMAGAIIIGGLALVDVPFDVLFALVVSLMCTPVLVALFTTTGSIEDKHLICNGTTVPLAQITQIRSVHMGNAMVCWVTYARGTGLFTPRLLTIPTEIAPRVSRALKAGREVQADAPRTNPIVRGIIVSAGLLFVGVALISLRIIDDPVVSLYFGGTLGLVGFFLCIAGWRGV